MVAHQAQPNRSKKNQRERYYFNCKNSAVAKHEMLQWQKLIQLQCPNSVVTQRLVLSQTQEILLPRIYRRGKQDHQKP